MKLPRLVLCLAVVAVLFAGSANGADAKRPPNILLILIDNLGQDWFGCYGTGEGDTTPNVDRLAREGIRFKNCYVTAYCSTTRVELMTGRYGFRTGWTVHHDAGKYGGGGFDWNREIAFPRLLQAAGYHTAIAGKWQLNHLQEQPDALARHGFDEYCIWPDGIEGEAARGRDYWNLYIDRNGERVPANGKFAPDLFEEYVVDFMERNRERPFFAFFSSILTHVPTIPTPGNKDRFEKLNETERFFGMVRHVDLQAGRLVAALDRLGLRDDTLVIFTTDNGTGSGHLGRVGDRKLRKGVGSILDTGINIPFVVNCPALVPGGRVSDQLIDYTDLLPTFCELTGARLPAGVTLDGRSFADTLRGRPSKTAPREWIFSQYANERVIRDRRFKLYNTRQLYDLQADPDERTNLIDSTTPEVVAAREKLGAALAGLPKDAELPFKPRSQNAFKLQGEGKSP